MSRIRINIKIRRLGLAAILLSVNCIYTLADTPPDPGGGPDPGGNPVGGGAPIDPGLFIYLIIATVYLGYQLFTFYKKHVME